MRCRLVTYDDDQSAVDAMAMQRAGGVRRAVRGVRRGAVLVAVEVQAARAAGKRKREEEEEEASGLDAGWACG